MHLVKIPQERYAMQQAMNIPLNKIPDDKHCQQLRPNRPCRYLNRHQVADPKYIGQEVIERLHQYTRHRIVTDQGEEEEIKEHVEYVQPEFTGPCPLFLFPGSEIFQGKEEEGYSDQPIEVIVPRWSRNLMEEIISVTLVGIDEDVQIVLQIHRLMYSFQDSKVLAIYTLRVSL